MGFLMWGGVPAVTRPSYTLRPATADDYDFLFNLLVASMKDYVEATWGWNDRFQRQRFAFAFDPARSQIVVVSGRDVGELSLRDEGEDLFLSKIYLLPAFQRRGLGTAILRDVLAEARRQNRPVRLRVLKVNPARRLYERLGFKIVAESKDHYVMRHA